MNNGQIANVDLIKQVNSAAVYRLVDLQGPISRVKIAEVSQLAPASVTKITRQLIAHGLIKEVAQQASTGGRRAISLTTEKSKFHFVAAKIGRRLLTLSLYNLAGQELAGLQLPIQVTEQDQLVDFLCQTLGQFIEQHSQPQYQLIAIAVTLSGLVNPQTGVVIYTPRYQMRDCPLAQIIAERFHVPAYVGNDTRAMALAEHYFGASSDCADSILISIHHGTGSGIMSRGQVFLGSNRNVGEIGHIQINPLGKRCHCGNYGCLETVASNEAIIDQVKHYLSEGRSSCLSEQEIDINSICQAANQGDALAISVLSNVGKYLGQAIAIMINLFNPEKILIAGEVMAAEQVLLPAIKQCVEHQSLPSFHAHLPIIAAKFQKQPTMGGFALVKRALLDGSLLQLIMEGKEPNP
ncbi:ROK family protein [Motilimonas eburnea]|uniref:ROK family protein n=1 Tax=Motilimonas eburnea TaxID=1737488 RepID=UPI001E48CA8B|nr:ROK family protein [Motilimonas eburnea]MCE2570233.1 ROK family transcriptional regulator [Motilimonas eburnea]